ncbi:mechanosensitive ion channel family protein [Sphingomonas carotinifaciens]|uniref:Small-conductance mechanosensitive channel n=1 Tax=Sphingomonas carotinifaciens TaxID=1166323 RepID=A0A1G7KD19_9SPHN|nr:MULTISPECIES: mechanosensitive ion channel family protein [Sphingomonas]MBB4085217.1 small-conductance mechanosensitive channel [Sphingomonas carotinifaciens]MWC43757.1 mechanosensitive ion channel [Sphingomonas carotinifaciens]SDF34874.1 Mechanosensitive ion channel [Sphingomonas carotinifaciens]
MSNNSAAAKEPIFDTTNVPRQIDRLIDASTLWVQTHWLQVLIAFGIGAVIVIALHAARRLGNRLCARPGLAAGWGIIIGRAVVRTNNFFIIMLAAQLVVGYAGAPREVASTVGFLFTVAAVFQAAIWARELILGAIEHRTQSEHYSGEALLSAMGLIRLLVTFALFAIALVVVLDNLGVNVTGLVAGLGVGGIAIGLAAQGIFADLFAALAIIFDRPFRRGDTISYGTTSGVIESIGLKSTRIRAFTGELRVISNRQLLDKEIQNTTVRNHIRIGFTIGVTYETAPETLERVPALLREIAEAEEVTVARAGFETFGASSLDYALQFDIAGNDWPTAHAKRDRIMVAIIRRFAAEKIGIAYPTQTTYTAAPDGTLVMPYAPSLTKGA